VSGALRQISVANYFMRHMKCRKDLFYAVLTPLLPALFVARPTQGDHWMDSRRPSPSHGRYGLSGKTAIAVHNRLLRRPGKT
jgi:hypothetical protein